jgi:hypothetical protein
MKRKKAKTGEEKNINGKFCKQVTLNIFNFFLKPKKTNQRKEEKQTKCSSLINYKFNYFLVSFIFILYPLSLSISSTFERIRSKKVAR